jgi:Carbohydrate family 9 binding domain-like
LSAAGVKLGRALWAEEPASMVSHHARDGFELTADPNARPWKGVRGVFAEKGFQGETVAGHRTDIRSRWTDRDLYFLFVCPYEKLNLKPDPVTNAETNHLWDWDVAEIFIGSDFQRIRHYYEFEVSPQGEWVDLDIDRDSMQADKAIKWDSGFANKTRIDAAKKIWYVEMRIPFPAIDKRKPAAGLEYRLNLYRCQGAKPDRKYIAWQSTGKESFHVPEKFGRMKLE